MTEVEAAVRQLGKAIQADPRIRRIGKPKPIMMQIQNCRKIYRHLI